MPILSIAAAALMRAARSTMPFLSIFLVPWLAATLLIIPAQALWFDRFGAASPYAPPIPMPTWIEAALFAPFGAAIAILALRYFQHGTQPDWRTGISLGQSFWLVMLVSFSWGCGEHLIDQFRRPVNAEYASLLLKLNAGSYDAIRTDWRVPLLTNWISFCFIILKTLLYFASAPLVWLVATRRQINLQSYWQLLRRHAVALFLFLLMIEIIIHQLQTFYAYGVPPFRVSGVSFEHVQSWRDIILPELLVDLWQLPLQFLTSLIWFSAVAEFFLEAERPETAEPRTVEA